MWSVNNLSGLLTDETTYLKICVLKLYTLFFFNNSYFLLVPKYETFFNLLIYLFNGLPTVITLTVTKKYLNYIIYISY
jgi:hypothetical protein